MGLGRRMGGAGWSGPDAGARVGPLGYNPEMFTGLVDCVAPVARVADGPDVRRLTVDVAWPDSRRPVGASVCVSGVCLTVVVSSEAAVAFDVAFETLERTTLGSVGVGDPVNLELSLRLGDPLDGHLVSGHVDGVGITRSRRTRGDGRELWVDVPGELLPFIATKGSICVDGVSLTVNRVDHSGFMVGIIPHTLEVTTLGHRRPGDRVNLEVDLLARYVARRLETGANPPGGVTMQRLGAAGFLPANEVK